MERMNEPMLNDGGRLTAQALQEPWRYGKGPLFGGHIPELKRRQPARRLIPGSR